MHSSPPLLHLTLTPIIHISEAVNISLCSLMISTLFTFCVTTALVLENTF